MNNHARVVKLELQHALFESLFFRQILDELRRQFTIDEHLKRVAIGDDVNEIPVVLLNILEFQTVGDRCDGRLVVLGDHEAVASEAAVLLAAWRVKIPSTQNLLANTEMTEVSMVTLEVSLAGFVLNRTNTDTTVGFARIRKTIAECHFEISEFFVFRIDEVPTSALVAISVNSTVLD